MYSTIRTPEEWEEKRAAGVEMSVEDIDVQDREERIVSLKSNGYFPDCQLLFSRLSVKKFVKIGRSIAPFSSGSTTLRFLKKVYNNAAAGPGCRGENAERGTRA